MTIRLDSQRVPIAAGLRKAGKTPYYGANGIQDYVDGFTHDGEFVLVAEDGANDIADYSIIYVKGQIWVNNHAHVLQGKSELTDTHFLSYAMKSIKIAPYLVGGGRAKLNAEVLMELQIKVPCLEEQENIADFFSALDHRIDLADKKLATLQTIKKGMLQKIFSQEYRFKDDNGDVYPEWEKAKLGKMLMKPISNGVFSDPDLKGSVGKKLINVVDLYTAHYIDEKGLGFLNIDDGIFRKNKVENGDLFFTRSSLKLEGIAHCNIYLGNSDDITYDGHIMKVSLNKNKVDPLFIFYESDMPFIRSQMFRLAKTTTMTTIGQNELQNVVYKVPCLAEQKKIAHCFMHLDSIIDAERQKLSSLQTIKKGLLQKMFV